jgi:hypothetical protein
VSDRRWLASFFLLLALMTTVPYLIAQSTAGDQWVFSGFLFAVEDGNSYIAKMLRGAVGDWLFRTPYTAFPQRGVLVFLPYLLLGKLLGQGNEHATFVAAFHGLRLFALGWELFALYRFVSLFLSGRQARRVAAVLGILGGGLGWLAALFIGPERVGLPLDWYSPEWFGFLGILGFPHLALARAGLLLMMAAYVSAGRSGKGALKSALWALALALIHPLGLVIGLALQGFHLASLLLLDLRGGLRPLRPWIRPVAAAWLMVSPLLAYYAWSSFRDPFLALWTAQNRLPTPPPHQAFLAYGLYAAVAVLGIRRFNQRPQVDGRLVILWALGLPLLAYMPVPLQRRVAEGSLVGWAILASNGLQEVGEKWRRLAIPAFVGLSLLSSALFLAALTLQATQPGEPAFLPAARVRSFEWLADHAAKDDLVVSSFETGNALPAWAPLKVVLGHGPESVKAGEIRGRVESLYAGRMSRAELCAWTQQVGLDWIYYGPRERALGPFPLGNAAGLFPLYRGDGIEIFRVAEEALCPPDVSVLLRPASFARHAAGAVGGWR